MNTSDVMTKAEAVALFGKTQVELAQALGLTKQAVSNWPAVLTQGQSDRVRGAALRLGKLSRSESAAA